MGRSTLCVRLFTERKGGSLERPRNGRVQALHPLRAAARGHGDRAGERRADTPARGKGSAHRPPPLSNPVAWRAEPSCVTGVLPSAAPRARAGPRRGRRAQPMARDDAERLLRPALGQAPIRSQPAGTWADRNVAQRQVDRSGRGHRTAGGNGSQTYRRATATSSQRERRQPEPRLPAIAGRSP